MTGYPANMAAHGPLRDKRDVALVKARKALRGINTFAWSAMTADCEAARKEGMRRITACRDALADIDELLK
jgi:hypothetical protein